MICLDVTNSMLDNRPFMRHSVGLMEILWRFFGENKCVLKEFTTRVLKSVREEVNFEEMMSRVDNMDRRKVCI